MTARQCPECGGLVASTIEACPHCGHIMSNVTCDASSRGENPYNSLGWVILAIFLFWPLGLVALYYHIKSEDNWDRGNQTLAASNGASSRRFAKYSVYAVLVALAIGIFLPFLFLGMFV